MHVTQLTGTCIMDIYYRYAHHTIDRYYIMAIYYRT